MALDQVTEAKIQYYMANQGALLQQLLKDVPGIRVFRYDSIEEPEQGKMLAQLEFAALQRIEQLYRPTLHEIICEKFRYCERRGGDTLQLVMAAADFAMALHGNLPWVTVLVLAVKSGALNRWCDCDSPAGSKQG